jgi:hypothetical protein
VDRLGFVRGRAGLRSERGGDSSGRNLWSSCDNLRFAGFIALDSLLFEETEHVVEDKVTVGLLSEEEALDKFAPGTVLI